MNANQRYELIRPVLKHEKTPKQISAETNVALSRERAAAEEANHRHDIVVMQMTRLLEYHQQPFWRKLFSRKALPPPEQIMDIEAESDES